MTDRIAHRAGAAAVGSFFFPKLVLVFFLLTIPWITASAQGIALGLEEAIETGVKNYQRIQAKRNYLNASQALSKNARNEYLPNVIASMQQSYGTVNGQYGPAAGVGVLGVASAGPSYKEQSWNAAFGALYILNTNWEVFSFGRVKSRIQLADAQTRRDSADVEQEEFIQRIKVAGAYLNLLAAQQFVRNARANLERAETVRENVRARVLSGLNAGVDSSLSNAEASRARLSWIEMQTNEQQGSKELAQLLNILSDSFVLDTTFLERIPVNFQSSLDLSQNPQVRFYQSRVDHANSAAHAVQRSIMPGVTLFGIYQARASGFNYNYTPEFDDRFTHSYSSGVNPARFNYVAGVSFAWNLMSPLRIKQQVHAQRFVAEAYRNEYDDVNMELQNQIILSDERIQFGIQRVQEVPLQHQAASDAYLQKSVLYRNGLTNIVDVQLTMLALSRAELDKSVAYINIWQALLLKSAATGDFDLFINQARQP